MHLGYMLFGNILKIMELKKIIFGIAVGGFLLFIAFKDINYNEVVENFSHTDNIYLIPAFLVAILISVLRSVRWGIILSPIVCIKQKVLFPITCIGYMAVIIAPIRLGELVRPLLVSNLSKIPISSAVATIFVERILDSLCIILMFFILLATSDLPLWMTKAGQGLLYTFFVLVIVSFIFYYKTDFCIRFLNIFLKILPQKIKVYIELLFETFVKGFKIISEPRKILYAILLTILIWVAAAFVIYNLYFFQGIELSFKSAFVLLVVIIIGVSIPTAPGFIGSFQFACVLALSIFDISKPDAVAFSISYYIFGIGLYVLLGLIFVPFTNFSLMSFKEKFRGV